jgi:hypothetical protein
VTLKCRLTPTGDTKRVPQPSGKFITKYYYKCECGDISLYFKDNIKRGLTSQCITCKQNRGGIPKHEIMEDKSKHELYPTWKAMRQRCLNAKCPEYKYYGKRGVQICSRWLTAFEYFLADMGERPSPEYSIDRIDVNGDYEPSNCRWATRSEQANNIRRKENISGHTGVYYKRATDSWYANLKICGKNSNVGSSKDKETAILYRKTAELWFYGFNKL